MRATRQSSSFSTTFSAPVSKETKAWIAAQPVGRFELTFTPMHGSSLNWSEGFFSELALQLKDRIMAAVDFFKPKRNGHYARLWGTIRSNIPGADIPTSQAIHGRRHRAAASYRLRSSRATTFRANHACGRQLEKQLR